MGPDDAHPQQVVLDHDIGDTRQGFELGGRDTVREAELHLVMREIAQCLGAIDLDQAPVADDRDAVAGVFDLRQDVAREEDGAALRPRLADQLVEGMLDERVETRGGLVEDEQVRAMLERDDEPDLLLVALGVLLEAARWVDAQPFDERGLVGRVHAASQVGEVLDGLTAGQAVVERELARDVADATVDRLGVRARLDAEHERPAAGRAG